MKPEKAEKAKAQAPAKIEATTAVSLPEPAPEPGAKTAKTLGNTAVSAISVLREGAKSGIIEAEDWSAADFQSGKAKAKHEKHVAEYGLDSFEEYTQGARDLLAAPLSEDVDGFRNDAGALYKYRKSTNDFAIGRVMEGVAYILTRFKPIDGISYWEGEMERERFIR